MLELLRIVRPVCEVHRMHARPGRPREAGGAVSNDFSRLTANWDPTAGAG